MSSRVINGGFGGVPYIYIEVIMNAIAKKFVQKGFSPVQDNGDYTLLKSNGGIVLTHGDEKWEGFFKGTKLHETQLEEERLRNILSLFGLIGLGITYLTTDITVVVGNSMAPTYSVGHIIVKSKFDKKLHEMMVARSSIVKLAAPDKALYIKRVVGVPGDEIKLNGPEVYINGELVDASNNTQNLQQQSYAAKMHSPNHMKDYAKSFKLKQNEYYVMGDNREDSVDSRDFGPIHRGAIVAIVQVGDGAQRVGDMAKRTNDFKQRQLR